MDATNPSMAGCSKIRRISNVVGLIVATFDVSRNGSRGAWMLPWPAAKIVDPSADIRRLSDRNPKESLAEEGWSPADDPDADIADAGGFLYADEDALKLHPFPALVSKDRSGRAVVRQ